MAGDLVTCMTDKRATALGLLRRYDLLVTTLYEWRKKLKKGTKIRETAGHSPLLDSAKPNLNSLQRANFRLKENFAPLMNIKAQESIKRDGGRGLLPSVSESTIYRTKKSIDASYWVAQTTTFARYNAKKDIRNYCVEAINQFALMNCCYLHLLVNADATTFAVYGEELTSKVVAIKNDNKAPLTLLNNDNFLGN